MLTEPASSIGLQPTFSAPSVIDTITANKALTHSVRMSALWLPPISNHPYAVLGISADRRPRMYINGNEWSLSFRGTNAGQLWVSHFFWTQSNASIQIDLEFDALPREVTGEQGTVWTLVVTHGSAEVNLNVREGFGMPISGLETRGQRILVVRVRGDGEVTMDACTPDR